MPTKMMLERVHFLGSRFRTVRKQQDIKQKVLSLCIGFYDIHLCER